MGETKAKILFVDDDNFLRKVYKSELGDHGYEVILAVDGDDGLEKAQLNDPDLIILDMIMPSKNGFEVLTELRNNPVTENIPVIILSNLGQKDDIKKGLDMGAVDYLVKDDTTLEVIVDKVQEFINSKTKSKKANLANGKHHHKEKEEDEEYYKSE
ncbi:response regulator [Candidatus Parcubacteria bacterium]|jgi:DNA-binding response OmpR family regulator|nr:response regulator [Candidatus Parcubacteria bacterium]